MLLLWQSTPFSLISLSRDWVDGLKDVVIASSEIELCALQLLGLVDVFCAWRREAGGLEMQSAFARKQR